MIIYFNLALSSLVTQVICSPVSLFDSGGGDRTHDLSGMNRTLSPAELRRQMSFEVQKIYYNKLRMMSTILFLRYRFYDVKDFLKTTFNL